MNPIRKLKNALGYSLQGLESAFRSEWAFRVEVVLFGPMAALALWLPVSPAEKAALLITLFAVLMAELANTAVETVIERISPEIHPLSGKAKDVASAVVLVALVQAVAVWAVILLPLL